MQYFVRLLLRWTAAACLIEFAFLAAPGRAADVEQWGRGELVFRGPAHGNPYVDVQFGARFSQGERTIDVLGFWDGGDVYKIRFSPPTPGPWQYRTRSNRPELDGKTGTLVAGPPSPGNRGPVEVFQTFYFRYADGTPYHQFGTTCYAWIHQPESLQQQTLKTLAAAPFNKIRFCTFPKAYAYNRNEPERFAFVKKADGTFDFTRPDPGFWRHLEQRILDLQRLGIEADLILWHPYDRWGFAQMGPENDDRYLRYCIARLGAFRNVWWSLANEYDLMAPGAMQGHRGDKQMTDWDRFFQILQREDGHQRLRGIHNCRGFYDHAKPWVTHVSIQSGSLHMVRPWREQYKKPIVVDECGYEGDIPEGWGNLKPEEMLRRFWIGTMCGGYVGHGETYKHPADILWWSKGGVLHGQSPARIAWLKQLMADGPAFHELEPQGRDARKFFLAKPGEFYLFYSLDREPATITLAGRRPYKVDLIDPWAMKVLPVGTAQPGEFTIKPPRRDIAFRFIPYAQGEGIRPEARIEAAPAAGVPPLTVSLQAVTTAAKADWDLGDGEKASGRQIRHTFVRPGIYTVTLTATADDGGVAMAQTDIVVDRETSEPLVRVGFARGEQPEVKLHGTAKRGDDGGLVFSDKAPWGWAEAGDQPIEELGGLRSFTITGWLKPSSLEVGSGGNRIVFCLNRDGDGIDLVCYNDGRMRLAVNQWPDNIRNDSSPGKLVVGKWTFFAVTYDAGIQKDNVSWYFTPPLDAPGPAEVRLDRKTTYNNGRVGDQLRDLAIGNFNRTMHSAGLDRQFRGEIRGLQIFGSRVSQRGAMELEAIKKHTQ